MRRLVTIAATLLALAGAVAVIGSARASGGTSARFDVIFDDARGLVAGQLVKIAGAQAGTIDDVTLTADFKARIEATVDSRFLPLHRDATCTIRPEGLIGENYVECDPGTAGSTPLPTRDGRPPTVPVTRTTEPVGLLDVFDIFNEPTRERLTVLLNELGIATSARGPEINDILRRANPSLALARRVIAILQQQRGQLATAVDATDTIVANGAGHTSDVQQFLDRAAALTSLTAAHRSALAQAVARLPATLAAAQPTLRDLDAVAASGTPLVRELHAAVPSLNRAATDLGPFDRAAQPALARLSSAVARTIPALRHSAPLLATLRRYADRSKGETALTERLFSNLQRHGFVENFLSVAYYIGAALARFDGTSHLLTALLVAPDNGQCGNYATTPVPACSAHYGAAPTYTPAARRGAATRSTGHERQARTARGAPARAPARTGPARPAPARTAPAGAAPAPATPAPAGHQTLQALVNYLLR